MKLCTFAEKATGTCFFSDLIFPSRNSRDIYMNKVTKQATLDLFPTIPTYVDAMC